MLLFKRKVLYLGHVISAEGIQVDLDALQSWQALKAVHELRKFLGFAGFYR